ncbi:MAG: BON domain-containing protein, partial [Patescibacteria group bacterium]|nr:BON domain-containing protein [Patescibacteria group bacterium]
MRRFVSGWMVAAVVSALASVAMAGNQEVAEQIAQNLRQSGKMQEYKIGVKYQEGTVWLVGRVASEQQLATALELVMQCPNVEHVVNNLSVSKPDSDQSANETAAVSSSQLRFGAVRDAAYESDVADNGSSAIRMTSHPSGLSAAQRLQRAIDGQVRDSQALPVEGSRTLDEANRAERLPASFEPIPAEPTSVAQPTLAHPTPAQRMPTYAEQQQQQMVSRRPMPVAMAQAHPGMMGAQGMAPSGPRPMYTAAAAGGVAPARYDQPNMPNYAWPSYAAYPNYAAVTYPKQYSPTAWPYIGPFYPYPQVPMGWRKVTLEW